MKSYTFTFTEFAKLMVDYYHDAIMATISDIETDKETLLMFLNDQKNLINKTEDGINDAIDAWEEVMADKFFHENPDVDDVLLEIRNGEKIWMTSKDNVVAAAE